MKELKGKQLSLISKIVAGIFIIVGFFVSTRPAGELVAAAVAIAGIFAPIDASMVVNNLKKPREGE
ncbi:MAG: hypothetical protein WC489_08465 [Patescibacteria group bacterium]|jgi:uncharacterized membrane protein YphA (DoxX/SURF4 family)